MKLKATACIIRSGREYAPGDVLDIEDKDEAERLIRLKAAEIISPQPQSSAEKKPEVSGGPLGQIVEVNSLQLDVEIKAKLVAAGFTTVKDIQGSTVDDIVALAGITEKQARQAIKAAK